MRLFNKGFSLVEVIIGLAIMSIVAGSVGAFIITSNNSYVRGSNEVTMQEEAQLTANQMIDLIIDVTNGVTLYEGTGDAIDLEGNVVANGVPVKELRLFNEDEVYMLRWQGAGASEYGSENQVYLSKETENEEGELDLSGPDFRTGDLLAQYVTEFAPDLSLLKDRKVILNMKFEYQGRAYNIAETIKLRNAIPYEVTPEHMYKDRPVVYEWIKDISISPKPAETTPGGTVPFSYSFAPGGDPKAEAQGVTWSVKGENGRVLKSGTTIDSNGMLIVDVDEELNADPTVPAMSVTVASVADPSEKDEAMVLLLPPTNGGVKSLVIEPKEATVMQGSSYDFGYTMTGSQSAIDMGVTWKVEVNSAQNADYQMHSATAIDTSGRLSVPEDQMLGGAILLVTVTAKADPKMSDTAIVNVVKPSLEGAYETQLIVTNLVTYDMGGGTMGYKAELECLTGTADYLNGYPKISWSVLGEDRDKYRLEPSSDPREHIENDGRPHYYSDLFCGTQMDTTVRVQAEVWLNSETMVVVGIDIFIPKLETTQNKDKPYIDANNFLLYRNDAIQCTIKNYTDENGNPKEVLWKFEDDCPLTQGEPNDRSVGFDYIAVASQQQWYQDMFPKTADKPYNVEQDQTYMPNPSDPYGPGTQNYAKVDRGVDTEVHAKYNLDWNTEYRLKLQAFDPDSGTLVAESIVVLPKFDVLFTDGLRYQYIKLRNGEDSWKQFDVKVYGVTPTGEHPFDMQMAPLISENPYVAGDAEKKGARILSQQGANFQLQGLQDVLDLVDPKTYKWYSSRPNSYFIIKMWDSSRPEAPRYLTLYVEDTYEVDPSWVPNGSVKMEDYLK